MTRTSEPEPQDVPGGDRGGAAAGPDPGNPARAATAFVIKLVVLTLGLGLGEAYLMQLSQTGDEPALVFLLRERVAQVGASIAQAFDDEVTRESVIIGGAQMQLIVSVECTALFAKALFCAAAVSYPVRWRQRLIGCLVGIVGVAGLNVLRVAGLVLIANGWPTLFHFAHSVLMQWFLISCVAPLWLAWAVWATRRSRAARG